MSSDRQEEQERQFQDARKFAVAWDFCAPPPRGADKDTWRTFEARASALACVRDRLSPDDRKAHHAILLAEGEHAARYFLMRRKDKSLPRKSKLDPLG